VLGSGFHGGSFLVGQAPDATDDRTEREPVEVPARLYDDVGGLTLPIPLVRTGIKMPI
jgi:hypothetical protein